MSHTLATAEGTRRYAARLTERLLEPSAERSPERPTERPAPEHFRTNRLNGSAGPAAALSLSSLGLGSYTGPATDAADREYADAVELAVRGGVNVIDCAINYRHMRSERALGAGLKRLFESGDCSRDEVFVMTKGGYLPFDGAPPRDPEQYYRETYMESGLLRPEQIVDGCHAIAPAYLTDQLSRSLANFGLSAVDIYFLHNVEQQLNGVDGATFRKRVVEAFAHLETEVATGRIGRYGVATWGGFFKAPRTPGALSLEALCELAREAGGERHHFAVVQAPFNPAMPEAADEPTQEWNGERIPLLQAAMRAGLYMVTSVPLMQTQVLPRLPQEWGKSFLPLTTRAQWALQWARSTPGVGAPLVGMRSRAHVEENLRVVAVPPLG